MPGTSLPKFPFLSFLKTLPVSSHFATGYKKSGAYRFHIGKNPAKMIWTRKKVVS
jgi:hypothetical protein